MSTVFWLKDQTQDALAVQEPNCIRCKFSRLSKRQYTGLECARHAPILVTHKSSCATWRAPGWPDVSASDWCGEFQAEDVVRP